jgi:hypothetical protein
MIPESEYHQVVAGTRPAPARIRFEELGDWVPRLNEVITRGVDLLLQWTMQDLSEDWEALDDYIERTIPDHRSHRFKCPEHYGDKSRAKFRRMLVSHLETLILDVAKMDTRYWGVADPTIDSWCSYCKSARPIGEFVSSEYTCESCFQRRKA